MYLSATKRFQTLFKKQCNFSNFAIFMYDRHHSSSKACQSYPQKHFTKWLHLRQCYCKLSSSTFATADTGISTIFSLSSGHGKCGVAIIRVSGPATETVLRKIAQFKELPTPRKVFLKTLVHPGDKCAIDKGLVLFFPKPHSFTGEDCVEFQVHGGPAVVAALLSALHALPGCQQAEPGQFTKRAFLNGKLDLTEVEGLGDLIHAETEAQRRQALRQMDGDLARLYGRWRKAIIKCVADLEAFIDFGEEQHIEDAVPNQVYQHVQVLKREITQHVNDNRQGERLREGVHVTIIGEPNVGKSSLLNAICQRPAAIVTDVAGTTRDIIESPVNIGGYPVLLNDTAGLRHTDDVVEREGVTRALKRAEQADIKILVLDLNRIDLDVLSDIDPEIFVIKQLKLLGVLSEGISSIEHTDNHDSTANIKDMENVQKRLNSQRPHSEHHVRLDTIVVLNKSDLLTSSDLKKVSKLFSRKNFEQEKYLKSKDGTKDRLVSISLKNHLNENKNIVKEVSTVLPGTVLSEEKSTVPFCCISCIHGDGMEDFLKVLKERVADMCGNPLSGHPSITQARHRSHLAQCLKHLNEYNTLHTGDIVLASQALRFALWEIGKITGKITSEEILDVIFKDFCIGK